MERPLGPGVRKKGRAYQVSVENLKEDKKRLGPEKFKKLMEENKMKKKGMLTGGQAKIAAKAPPPNKIDAKDFAVLRKEKAKGRGMGLQDESIQPGKVMKAKRGKSIQGTTAKSATKNIFPGYQKVFDTGSDRSTPRSQRGVSTIVGVKPNVKKQVAKSKKVTYSSMDEMRQKTLGYKKGESTEAFKARKANESFARKAAKATGGRGKAALAVATAGVAAYQYLKSKMKKNKDGTPKKKMGGGIMQKPMGYKEGMGPAGARSKKKKLDIEAIVNSKQKFKGPKSTEGSLGYYVNNMRSSKDYYNAQSKMGGGMMQKPMGYATGMGPATGYKSKEARKKAEKNIKQARSKEGLRSFLSERKNPMRKERYMEGRKARHTELKKKIGKAALNIAARINPVTSVAKSIGKVMGEKSKKRDFQKGDYGDISVKKMSGGMMKRYNKGGGADSGRTGEARSKAGVQEVRIKKGIKNVGKKIKDIVTLKKFHDLAKKRSKGKGPNLKGTGEPLVRRMGGGMMQKPTGYSTGMGPGGSKAGKARTPEIRSQEKKELIRKAGRPRPSLGALTGRKKEDSSVTLAKFIASKIKGEESTVKQGGMKADRLLYSGRYRSPEKAREYIKSGKSGRNPDGTQMKDAKYYKSIGATGKRGDKVVKDFFKPFHMKKFNYAGGGMTNKPMGYKSGTSVTVKCKLGRNKPTKIT
jgi:hypothetical protein